MTARVPRCYMTHYYFVCRVCGRREFNLHGAGHVGAHVFRKFEKRHAACSRQAAETP